MTYLACDDGHSFHVPGPAGAGSLRLDDLRFWYVQLSASLRIDGPERLDELAFWETGEGA